MQILCKSWILGARCNFDCNLQQALIISAYQKSLDMKEVLFCEFTQEKFYTQYMKSWKNVDRLFCIVED